MLNLKQTLLKFNGNYIFFPCPAGNTIIATDFHPWLRLKHPCGITLERTNAGFIKAWHYEFRQSRLYLIGDCQKTVTQL